VRGHRTPPAGLRINRSLDLGDAVAGNAADDLARPAVRDDKLIDCRLQLIGFFVNTLALRVQVRPDDSFRRLLRGVREVTVEAYAHQELVSLGFARAAAASVRLPLHAYLAELTGGTPAVPRLLVNVFSGGIHLPGAPAGFQQVMVIPATGELVGDVRVACAVFEAAERLAQTRYGPHGCPPPVDSSCRLAARRRWSC
jgi:hypothetical protein